MSEILDEVKTAADTTEDTATGNKASDGLDIEYYLERLNEACKLQDEDREDEALAIFKSIIEDLKPFKKQLEGKPRPDYIAYLFIGTRYAKTKNENYLSYLEEASQSGEFQAYKALALAYERLEDYKKAIEYYEEATKHGDDNVGGSYYEIANLYRKLEDAEQAISYLNKAANWKHPKSCILLAEAARSQKRYKDAIAYYRMAATYDSSLEDQLLLDIGYCFTKIGNLAQAIQYYTIAAERGNDMGWINIAMIFGKMKDYTNVAKYLEKAAALNGKHKSQAVNMLGMNYTILGDEEKAKECFVEAAELGSPEGLTALGLVEEREHNFEKALECYVKALMIDGVHLKNSWERFAKCCQAYGRGLDELKNYAGEKWDELNPLVLGLYNEAKGENELAIESFLKVLETSQKDQAELYAKVAVCYGKLGNDEKLAEYQIKAAEAGNGTAWVDLAHHYERNANWEKAIEYYTKAAEADPDKKAHYYYRISFAYRRLGDHDEAARYCEKSGKAGLDAAWHLLARSHQEVGNLNSAVGYYEKAALLKGPYQAESLFQAAQILYENDKKKNAFKALKIAGELGYLKAWLLLGEYATQDGDYKTALDAYDHAMEETNWSNGKIIFMIADIYRKQKKYDLAKKYYEQAVENGSTSAWLGLGRMWEYGEGVEVDYKKAIECYEKGTTGDAALKMQAYYFLGNIYKKIGESSKSLDFYQQSAAGGYDLACVELGRYYLDKENDIDKAKEYFTKAAELDGEYKGIAHWELGEILREQELYSEAFEYYQKAAEQGHFSGYCSMAIMYQQGEGVKEDYKKAVEYLKKALEVQPCDKGMVYRLLWGFAQEVGDKAAAKKYGKLAAKNESKGSSYIFDAVKDRFN